MGRVFGKGEAAAVIGLGVEIQQQGEPALHADDVDDIVAAFDARFGAGQIAADLHVIDHDVLEVEDLLHLGPDPAQHHRPDLGRQLGLSDRGPLGAGAGGFQLLQKPGAEPGVEDRRHHQNRRADREHERLRLRLLPQGGERPGGMARLRAPQGDDPLVGIDEEAHHAGHLELGRAPDADIDHALDVGEPDRRRRRRGRDHGHGLDPVVGDDEEVHASGLEIGQGRAERLDLVPLVLAGGIGGQHDERRPALHQGIELPRDIVGTGQTEIGHPVAGQQASRAFHLGCPHGPFEAHAVQ